MNLMRRRSSFPRDDFFFPIQQHFDKVFENFLKDFNVDSLVVTGNYPKMDVVTEGNEWVIKAAIPGVNPEDIEVSFVPNPVHHGPSSLVIRGKMSEEHQSPEGADYFLRELKKSSFQREIVLPKWIKGDPEAVFKDGMLRLSWPLPEEVVEEAPAARRIEIKTHDVESD